MVKSGSGDAELRGGDAGGDTSADAFGDHTMPVLIELASCTLIYTPDAAAMGELLLRVWRPASLLLMKIFALCLVDGDGAALLFTTAVLMLFLLGSLVSSLFACDNLFMLLLLTALSSVMRRCRTIRA